MRWSGSMVICQQITHSLEIKDSWITTEAVYQHATTTCPHSYFSFYLKEKLMSHDWKEEKLKWTKGVFRSAQIIIDLDDGTNRIMKFEGWDGGKVLETTRNVLALAPNTPIEFATWGGYSTDKWFCDVRKI
jgi:hypothetical protein